MRLKFFLGMRLIGLMLSFIGLAACSTLEIKPYPDEPASLFESATSTKGLIVIADPILRDDESKDYFGTRLSKSEILAIHFTIRNNSQDSYLINPDLIRITDGHGAETAEIANSSAESDSASAGTAFGVAGIALFSPLAMGIAVQEISDATVISENFERSRLRTTTLGPGNQVAGFLYFSLDSVRAKKVPTLCVKAQNPISGDKFLHCVALDMKS